MLAGWTLVLIDFPAKAVPGRIGQGALDGIAVAFMLSMIPGVIAAGFYAMLRITRVTFDATRAALEIDRAERAATPTA